MDCRKPIALWKRLLWAAEAFRLPYVNARTPAPPWVRGLLRDLVRPNLLGTLLVLKIAARLPVGGDI